MAPGPDGQPQTPEQITPSVTWRSRNNNNSLDAPSDKLYHAGVANYSPFSEIMVGDIVTSPGNEIPGGTRVTQIDRKNAFIYISTQVNIPTPGVQLTFTRRGQDISTYFNNHSALDVLFLNNCRLTGEIPPFAGCRNLRLVEMNNNLLSSYQPGTLKNITGVSINTNSAPRLQRFTLTNNALNAASIRSIIRDLHDIAVFFATKRIRINFRVGLLGTKLNLTSGQYENWTRAEIFTGASTSGDGAVIPDPLQVQFDQMGPGTLYPGITIDLF